MNREIKFRGYDPATGKMEYSNGAVDFSFWKWVGYDSETILMQFTGLNAVSINKEVYEGDICTATFKTKEGVTNLTGRIIMDEFMWCLETKDETYSLNRVTLIDVIGNEYQNPELLSSPQLNQK